MKYRINFLAACVVIGIVFMAMRNYHIPNAANFGSHPRGYSPGDMSGQDASSRPASGQEEYVCTPCGGDCDKKVYKEAGTCPVCGMALVKKSTVNIKTIQPGDVCQYVASHPGVVLLDVRSKAEYEGKADGLGTLRNAINIPVNELPGRIHSIDSLKNTEIIVYCSHSHRSSTASYLLTQNGFSHVLNMAGGMSQMKDNPCKIQSR